MKTNISIALSAKSFNQFKQFSNNPARVGTDKDWLKGEMHESGARKIFHLTAKNEQSLLN